MLPDYFEFSLPTRVVYGIGILEQPEPVLRPFAGRKAILVTDKILLKNGPSQKVRQQVQEGGVQVACTYSEVPPNSTIDTVTRCAALAKRHRCDMFIAIGGGSVIDTAKVANLLVSKGGRVEDHMGAFLLDRNEQLLPSIVIPTTAGTGSEVTRVAVIADPENDVKLPFSEEQFLPTMAILDPQVTVSLPGKLTAATGMDALCHAIEAYVDKECNPASDALSLRAIAMISDNILRACAYPDDLNARGNMLVGSFLAGLAFSHSMVGMTHGIAHALGGVYHIPHGVANALLLPEVMAYNLDARMDRYADVAMALGVQYPQAVAHGQSFLNAGRLEKLSRLFERVPSISGWIDTRTRQAKQAAARTIGTFGFVDDWFRSQAAQAGIEKVRTLVRQLAHLTGLPLNLRDAGVSDQLARLEQVATTAMEDGAMLYNPVEPQREDVLQIVKKLYYTRTSPLPVSDRELQSAEDARGRAQSAENVFADSAAVYAILGGFYEQLKADAAIGDALLDSNLCVQFVYENPDAVITIDARGDTLNIVHGDFDDQPEVTMTMNADFAHRFWHGKANLLTALTRRAVRARGNVPKTLRLLPILKPAYELYPNYLRDHNWGELVMD